MRTRTLVITTAVLAAIAGGWGLWTALPFGGDGMRQSTALLTGHADLCMVTEGDARANGAGADTIVVASDSVARQGVWVNRWWWLPSCGGRIMTAGIAAGRVGMGAAQWADTLHAVCRRLDVEQQELDYYLRSHGVMDEGYTQIADMAVSHRATRDSMVRLAVRVDSALAAKRAVKRRMVTLLRLAAVWHDGDGRADTVALEPVEISTSAAGQPLVLRTATHRTPLGIRPASRFPWSWPATRRVLVASMPWTAVAADVRRDPKVVNLSVHGNNSMAVSDRRVVLAEGRMLRGRHDLPPLFAPDGAPVFTQRGYFVGVVCGQSVGLADLR